jgi:hypothetical protein
MLFAFLSTAPDGVLVDPTGVPLFIDLFIYLPTASIIIILFWAYLINSSNLKNDLQLGFFNKIKKIENTFVTTLDSYWEDKNSSPEKRLAQAMKKIFCRNMHKEETQKLAQNIETSIFSHIEDICKRIKIFEEHQENSSQEDREAIHEHFITEIADLVRNTEQLAISFSPKLTREVMEEIIKPHQEAPLLPAKTLDALVELEQLIQKSAAVTPNSHEEAYILQELPRRYLPDTLKAYLKVRQTAPILAEELLRQQVESIRDYVGGVPKASLEQEVSSLLTNGLFLQSILHRQT